MKNGRPRHVVLAPPPSPIERNLTLREGRIQTEVSNGQCTEMGNLDGHERTAKWQIEKLRLRQQHKNTITITYL